MNQKAIDEMATLTQGRADVRRILASYPALHDADGLTVKGRIFASAYAGAVSSGSTGRQAEAAARKAAGL